MTDLYIHIESCHHPYFRNSPVTCTKCREDLSTDKNGAPHAHDQSQCVRTTAGESGIMLVSELKRCRQDNVGRHAEKAWTHFVEIAVPYLTAKARIAPLNTGSLDLVLDSIYRIHYSTKNDGDRPPTSQLNIAGPAPTVPYGTQSGSSLYQDGVQVAQYQPVPRVRNANSQQLPRQDSNLQATQNEARSGKKRKKSQQALPQAAHSQLNGNGTLTHQEQVNQYAPQPQASHLQLAQTSHVTTVDVSGMQGSSINQHSLDIPQSQGYSTSNGFDISPNWLQSNIIPAENPSEVTGSMAPQSIGVSQPQHLDEAQVHSQSMN
ncbi:hypothetical protein FNAPI_5132 [Fusarium napiforme]|uniref:Uncharacterized protein n=1 Tax=Fusarium napiforme TaxID=42672 RepID=A0A8H5N9A1_9HYPO|nr:hypothetical protein FNAPI_5132 [Fusarium napiforme]